LRLTRDNRHEGAQLWIVKQRDLFNKALTWLHFMVEFPGAMAYLPGMSQTLEKRVEDLEKKVAELSAEVLQLRPIKKDWRRTVGCMPDDEITREAARLGREYRKQQTYEKEIAGS